MEPAALLLQVLLTLILAAAAETPVALFVTRRKVRHDIAQAEARLMAKLASVQPPALDVQAIAAAVADALPAPPTMPTAEAIAEAVATAVKPGKMNGGVDPIALNDAKAAKAEERRRAAVEAEVAVKAFLVDRLGPRGVAVAEGLLGRETMQRVYESGQGWMRTLAPFLDILPQKNGVDAARAEAATYQLE